MYKTYSEFLAAVPKLRIAVLGAGISNRPLIRLLLKAGASLTVLDKADATKMQPFMDELVAQGLHAETAFGLDYLQALHNFDLIFKTPVLRPDLPELLAEKERGALLTTEMELFFRYCPAPIIAITGSDGKTTTATLAARILEAAGRKVWLGGNIGAPLLPEMPDMKASDAVVVELSSFQLMTMHSSPQTAVITNISPNHLDVHKDYAEYWQAKANIFRYQHFDDTLVLNGRDALSPQFAREAPGRVLWVEERPFGESPLFGLEGDELFYQADPRGPRQHLLSRRDMLLPGRFNAINVLAAFAATQPLAGVTDLRRSLEGFPGVEHRQEWIREIDGVNYYNSSVDSSPTRSLNTLSAFHEQGRRVHMIAGGKDKKLQYEALGEAILENCAGLYLSGANAGLIRAGVEKALAARAAQGRALNLPIHDCADYDEALALARQAAEPGEVILLSPAGTSFDRYANFMERGEAFKAAVLALSPQKSGKED